MTEDQEVTDKLRMIIERYDHVLMSVTNLVKEKEELGIIADQVGTPT